jgi:hypothetical protein
MKDIFSRNPEIDSTYPLIDLHHCQSLKRKIDQYIHSSLSNADFSPLNSVSHKLNHEQHLRWLFKTARVVPHSADRTFSVCMIVLVTCPAQLSNSRHQFCSPVRWTETQDLLLSGFRTRKTVEIGPAETLTTMIKRTRDLVYRPYDTANSVNREFLSLKKNRDEVYYIGQEKEVKVTLKKEATDPAPAEVSAAVAPQQAASPAPAPISAGPIEDAFRQARSSALSSPSH